jgi:TolB-like protein/DNA-binding SARP family transcriptional activator/Tfp pilus assembly protein PilF
LVIDPSGNGPFLLSAAAASKLFSLKLFGGVTLLEESGPVPGRAAQRHRLALLALLARAGARGLTREKLSGLLWPDTASERARQLLSDSVYRINAALGGDVILASGEDLRHNPERLSCDVVDFESALDRGERRAAVSLYSGAFLDGFSLPDNEAFDHWVDAERERLRRAYSGALEALANEAEETGDLVAARDWLRQLADHEPYSSRVTLRLIAVLELLGERGGALQVARAHEANLRQQLELEPGPELLAVINRLKTGPKVDEAGEVSVVDAETSSADAATSSPASAVADAAAVQTEEPLVLPGSAGVTARGNVGRNLVAAVVLLAALLGGGAVGWFAFTRETRAVRTPGSIAVLPFADHGDGGGNNQYFAAGLTEELINTLARMTNLSVAGRTSAFALQNTKLDVREIGRRLGVASVLEGSVRRGSGKLRIAVQLIDVRNGYERWSQTYDRPESDVLAVQEEIAHAIAQHLEGTLLSSQKASTSAPVVDSTSYDLYLLARYHWHRRGRRDLDIAVANLERAVQRSPRYARGWAGLADAYAISGFYDYLPPRLAFPRARQAAEKALQLDPKLAAAYATLGYIELYYNWNFSRSEEHFLHAIELDPSYSTAQQWYGNLLTAAGRFPEAVHAMRQAQLLDPLSLIATTAHGWTLYYERRYEDANRQLLRGIALDSTFQLAHLWRGGVLEALGDLDSAQASIQRGVDLSGGSAIYMTALARTYALRGYRAEAKQLLLALEKGEHGYAPPYELAKVRLALGEPELALDLLERALEERSHSIAFIRVDPQLDVIRQHTRFHRLLQRVN